MPDFLLEIGCEEIPARMIDGAREELARRVTDLLRREGLAPQGTSAFPSIEAFSTPRRLAVLARGLPASQNDSEEQITGPAVRAAFKDGQPTVAAQKFAEKVQVALEKLERINTPKGEYLAARVIKRGRSAGEILREELPREISSLYWAKSMYWRPRRTTERFVRPVRWLVALLDESVVPLELFGMTAARESWGHRTLGGAVALKQPREYLGNLRQKAVVASPGEREQVIRKALDKATRSLPGARWREDASLLNKVVNLTEWPSVIRGGFDPEFLELPEEVLVTVMRDHQNYFAIENASGRLAPHFLAVLNTDGDPEGIIRHGHERVLRARFNDARFFWQTDQKISLRERVEMLKSVTFQKDLGSYYEKTERLEKLAFWLAEELRKTGVGVDAAAAREAARLAKTDLTTELVKEFTELQGIIGGLYARHQGLAENVAAAIYDHYQPLAMEDDVPRAAEGAVVSIADKADSIVGMFALGLIPSGSKDPFALRRQANGIVKIIAELGFPLSLERLFARAREGYGGSAAESRFKAADQKAALGEFLRERIAFYLRDVRGFAYDVVAAVLAANADDVADALARAEAVARVRESADFASIAVAFKRTKNILRQAREGKRRVAEQVEAGALREPAERGLYEKMQAIAPRVRLHSEHRNYAAALGEMAAIRPAVDSFFNEVMVMVEDEAVRANRLALLETLLREFSSMADFSEIVSESKQP